MFIVNDVLFELLLNWAHACKITTPPLNLEMGRYQQKTILVIIDQYHGPVHSLLVKLLTGNAFKQTLRESGRELA